MVRAAGPGDAIVPERAVGAGSGTPAAAVPSESEHGGDLKIAADAVTVSLWEEALAFIHNE